MNLENYDEQVKSTKTVRILVYPNITFGKDLEKDSYIQVIKKQITLNIKPTTVINLSGFLECLTTPYIPISYKVKKLFFVSPINLLG